MLQKIPKGTIIKALANFLLCLGGFLIISYELLVSKKFY